MRLLLWHLLDWYSQQFNSRWGFPTSCVLDPANPERQDICNANDSNHRYLVFFPELLAERVARNYPRCVTFLATFYFAILAVMFSWKLELSSIVSFSLIFSIIIGLVHYRGRVNLPYILAKFQIIKADDVHHGTALLYSCSIVFRGLSSSVSSGMDLAAWTNFVFFSTVAVFVSHPPPSHPLLPHLSR